MEARTGTATLTRTCEHCRGPVCNLGGDLSWVQGSGFRVQGPRSKVQSCRVQGAGYPEPLHLRCWQVAHRDLKSLNILMRKGTCKIADFGLFKVSVPARRTILQGYIAHKKLPTPLAPPKDPRHTPTVGS